MIPSANPPAASFPKEVAVSFPREMLDHMAAHLPLYQEAMKRMMAKGHATFRVKSIPMRDRADLLRVFNLAQVALDILENVQ